MFLCSPVTCVFVIVAVNGLLGSYVLTDRNVYNKLVSQSGSESAATVPQQPRGSGGLWPGKVNVAARARVWANATCGERRGEEFCRLATGGGSGSGGGLSPRGEQCAVCDARSSDPNKRHLAAYAVDGDPTRWWQSPTLQQGLMYQWVTFTLDLKQDYHISDVIVKAGPSPRPGNWVLERSRDGGGDAWLPWHYFAISDDECWAQYGVRPAPPQPTYKTDSEVVCTSYYSKIKPLEGGEELELTTFMAYLENKQ
ncbi:hypothetical protein LSTR_LSTR013418 [Laodelphax striatellus]|uniref:Laminin N-terminal domain-containing protein n=1 Tax=Laodelphax striatellus TaxID=195883 RepID=A0A482XQC2_LAOST|nr:hypothetical protein LSTR_LSTR013418 [Laodelphax striatellus]